MIKIISSLALATYISTCTYTYNYTYTFTYNYTFTYTGKRKVFEQTFIR